MPLLYEKIIICNLFYVVNLYNKTSSVLKFNLVIVNTIKSMCKDVGIAIIIQIACINNLTCVKSVNWT